MYTFVNTDITVFNYN